MRNRHVAPKLWRFACLFICLAAWLAHPAYAKAPPLGERTQETIPVSKGKFLIVVGAPDESQNGYTIDMIQVEEGIPYYIPLFIEDYDPDTNTAKLGYGVAFYAKDYSFNKKASTLDINTLSPDTTTRYHLHYTLDDDILHLQTVTTQPERCTGEACKPKQIYTRKK
jgi:hypothetical protein